MRFNQNTVSQYRLILFELNQIVIHIIFYESFLFSQLVYENEENLYILVCKRL